MEIEWEAVQFKIYDILGKEVALRVNRKQNPRYYKVNFDGSELPSGVYYYLLKVKNFQQTKKMVLVR